MNMDKPLDVTAGVEWAKCGNHEKIDNPLCVLEMSCGACAANAARCLQALAGMVDELSEYQSCPDCNGTGEIGNEGFMDGALVHGRCAGKGWLHKSDIATRWGLKE